MKIGLTSLSFVFNSVTVNETVEIGSHHAFSNGGGGGYDENV